AAVMAHPAERQPAHGPRRYLPRIGGTAAVAGGSRVLPQQEQQLRWSWKLRRGAEAAVMRVERVAELAYGGGQRIGAGNRPRRRRALDGAQLRGQRLGGLRNFPALRLPHARNLLEDLDEPGAAPARGRRKVGAAVERLQVRRQPDAHRPSAAAGRRLHEGHVDAIDVGTLFTIDLD